MDPHSELEVKFAADAVDPNDLFTWLDARDVRRYHVVDGFDTYYRRGEHIVRHRCDGTKKLSVMTTKTRKSQESLTDRNEVDLPQDATVSAHDVGVFLARTGWEPEFTIDKTSYIAHVHIGGAHICVALYDVFPRDRSYPDRRFLEIEIEKDSLLTPDQGAVVLEQWTRSARESLALGDPLNESLYEMYRPQPKSEQVSRCTP